MSSETENDVQKMLSGKLRLRPASTTDINFIFNSWLKSYRNSFNTDKVANEIFFTHHHKLIEGLCRTCPITILCNDEDSSQIFGYICHEIQEDVPVVHFVYVKEVYRRLGLGKILMEHAQIDLTKPFFFTHRTKISKYLEPKYLMIHNPYLAYFGYSLIRKEELEAASVKRG